MMSRLNHCRICLTSVPESSATVYTKLDDGTTLADKLDELFDVLVGDYSDADVLKLLCVQCTEKIHKCASGKLTPVDFMQIAEFFQNNEGKARLFVRGGCQMTAITAGDPTVKAITNSPYGMSTPKQPVKRPLDPALATASTSKKTKMEDPSLEWLRSQPGISGLGGTPPVAARKKVVVREIQLDDPADDDGRETVIKTKCPFCNSIYVLNSALIKHISNKHPDKPVKFKKCLKCQKSFLNAAELKVHKCAKASPNRRSFGWYRRGFWW